MKLLIAPCQHTGPHFLFSQNNSWPFHSCEFINITYQLFYGLASNVIRESPLIVMHTCLLSTKHLEQTCTEQWLWSTVFWLGMGFCPNPVTTWE